MLGASRVLYLSVYAYNRPHLVICKTRPKPYASTSGKSLSPRRVRASSFLLLHHHNHAPGENHPFPPIADLNNLLFDPLAFWWPWLFYILALVRWYSCLVILLQSNTRHLYPSINCPACPWFENENKNVARVMQHGLPSIALLLARNDLKANVDLPPPDRQPDAIPI